MFTNELDELQQEYADRFVLVQNVESTQEVIGVICGSLQKKNCTRKGALILKWLNGFI